MFKTVYVNDLEYSARTDRPYVVRIAYETGIVVDHSVKSFGAAKRWLMRGAKIEMPRYEASGRLFFEIIHVPTAKLLREGICPDEEALNRVPMAMDFDEVCEDWMDV